MLARSKKIGLSIIISDRIKVPCSQGIIVEDYGSTLRVLCNVNGHITSHLIPQSGISAMGPRLDMDVNALMTHSDAFMRRIGKIMYENELKGMEK